MTFAFSKKDQDQIEAIFSRYPKDQQRSAVMPLLTLAQESNGGWLSQSAIECVANLLKVPTIRVLEIATFYSMYNLEPVGEHVLKICTTTPCWLRGSDELVHQCKNQLDLEFGQTKKGITLKEVECLGACVKAPLVELNGEYVEEVDVRKLQKILSDLSSQQQSSKDTK